MFAQLPDPTSFQAIGWIVVTVAAVAHSVNQLAKLVDRVRGTPSTAELQDKVQSEFATTETVLRVETELKEEISAVDRKVDEFKDQVVKNGEVRRRSIEDKVERLRQEVKQDTIVLGEKMGAMGEHLAELRGVVNMTNQNITGLSSQVQNLSDNGPRRGI